MILIMMMMINILFDTQLYGTSLTQKLTVQRAS